MEEIDIETKREEGIEEVSESESEDPELLGFDLLEQNRELLQNTLNPNNEKMEDEQEEEDDEDNVSNDSDDFRNILKFYQNEIKGKGSRSSSRLPRAVSLLVGEANQLYLEKNFDEAIETCCQVIKTYPENPEPYHLLSVIYEELGDKKRSADFLFIETQLNYKSDINSWWKLADKFFGLNMLKNAGYCYGRALKCDKTNITLLFKKAQCYDRLKDTRGAIKYYKKIYNLVRTQKEVVIKLAKLYAKLNHHMKAVALLVDYLIRNQESVDFDVANIACELLISKKLYRECCDFIESLAFDFNSFKQFQKKVELISDIGPNQDLQAIQDIPDIYRKPLNSQKQQLMLEGIPIDILLRYAESLVKLNHIENAMPFLSYLESLDNEEYYDILLDLIEIYSDAKKYKKALNVCKKVIEAEAIEDKSVIMLKIGILWGKLERKDEEVKAYQNALRLNPRNNNVRFRLSELYESEGRIKEALEILNDGGVLRALAAEPRRVDEEIFGSVTEDGRTLVGQEKVGGDSLLGFRVNEQDNRAGVEGEVARSETAHLIGKRGRPEDDVAIGIQSHKNLKVGHQTGSQPHLSQPNQPLMFHQPASAQGHQLIPNDQPPVNNRSIIRRLLDDIKYEEAYNEKTKRRMENLVELNEDFFVTQHLRINKTIQKYQFDKLLLEFRRCEINMKSDPDSFHNSAKYCVLNSLLLEVEKQTIETSIYGMLLRESKGRIRASLQDNIIGDQVDELNSLFIFKRKKAKKFDKFETLFKDSKNKSRVAKRMSEKIMSRMSTVSSMIKEAKYVEIIERALIVFYGKKKFELVAKICEQLLKLRSKFGKYGDFCANFYLYGFLANARLQKFEKSYVYFRKVSKVLLKVFKRNNEEVKIKERAVARPSLLSAAEDPLSAPKPEMRPDRGYTDSEKLRAALIKKFKDLEVGELQTLCFTTIYLLFSNFKDYNASSRAFFQKFKDQFEGSQMQPMTNHLSAILYIYSGSIEQAKMYIEKNYERGGENTLYDFMLGFCYLMDSTNRMKANKLESIGKAFNFFEKYKDSRSGNNGLASSGLGQGCLEEAYYNIGRALAHINCPRLSVEMFRKARESAEDKIIERNRMALESMMLDENYEYGENVVIGKEEIKEKKEFEMEVKRRGLYYNSAFNEMVWYKLTRNKVMEKFMIDNYLTFNEL